MSLRETTMVTLGNDQTVPLTVTQVGAGRPALVLHGGGGPFTVAGLAAHLGKTRQVLTPTLPGWDGTPRPAWLRRVGQLAEVLRALLEARDLRDVLVVGSSLGGWLAAELALGDVAQRVTGLVLVDAGGIAVPGQPIVDVFTLDPRELAALSFHDPTRLPAPPPQPPSPGGAPGRANLEALRAFAGDPYMHDPTLRSRLPALRLPTLVLWGQSDRVITPAYGAAFAAALPHGRFELIPQAGHLPHLEQPGATFAAIDRYLREVTPALNT